MAQICLTTGVQLTNRFYVPKGGSYLEVFTRAEVTYSALRVIDPPIGRHTLVHGITRTFCRSMMGEGVDSDLKIYASDQKSGVLRRFGYKNRLCRCRRRRILAQRADVLGNRIFPVAVSLCGIQAEHRKAGGA